MSVGGARRAKAFAGVALAVALLHLAVLGGGFSRWTPPARASGAVVTVRTMASTAVRPPSSLPADAGPPSPSDARRRSAGVVDAGAAAPVGAGAAPRMTAPPARHPDAAAPRPLRPPGLVAATARAPTGADNAARPIRVDAKAIARAEMPTAATSAVGPATDVAPLEPSPDAVRPVAPPADAAPNADDDDTPPPVYRTRLPPPTTLRYAVRRGQGEGDGELRWQIDADGYALDWQSRTASATDQIQSSRGRIDAAGIAPLRFVDRRSSRPATAVNFRREIGRISFSRKAADAALSPGAQDRLSWLVQIAAIAAAEPERRSRGAELRMSVAGAGGDVAVWRFVSDGIDAVATDAGPVDALHFVRDARGPYDLRVDVWLDPADGHYLPVQAAWRSGSGPADAVVLRRLDARAR